MFRIIKEEDRKTKIGEYTGKKFKIGDDTWQVGEQSEEGFYYTECVDGKAKGEESTIDEESLEGMKSDNSFVDSIKYTSLPINENFVYYKNNRLYFSENNKVIFYNVSLNFIEELFIHSGLIKENNDLFETKFIKENIPIILNDTQKDSIKEKLNSMCEADYGKSHYVITQNLKESIERGKITFEYDYCDTEDYVVKIVMNVEPKIQISTFSESQIMVARDLLKDVLNISDIDNYVTSEIKKYSQYELEKKDINNVDFASINANIVDYSRDNVTFQYSCEFLVNSGYIESYVHESDHFITDEVCRDYIESISNNPLFDVFYNDIRSNLDMIMQVVQNVNTDLSDEVEMKIGLVESKFELSRNGIPLIETNKFSDEESFFIKYVYDKKFDSNFSKMEGNHVLSFMNKDKILECLNMKFHKRYNKQLEIIKNKMLEKQNKGINVLVDYLVKYKRLNEEDLKNMIKTYKLDEKYINNEFKLLIKKGILEYKDNKYFFTGLNTQKPINEKFKKEICPDCFGKGIIKNEGEWERCHLCHGKGYIEEEVPEDHKSDEIILPRPEGGSIKVSKEPIEDLGEETQYPHTPEEYLKDKLDKHYKMYGTNPLTNMLNIWAKEIMKEFGLSKEEVNKLFTDIYVNQYYFESKKKIKKH